MDAKLPLWHMPTTVMYNKSVCRMCVPCAMRDMCVCPCTAWRRNPEGPNRPDHEAGMFSVNFLFGGEAMGTLVDIADLERALRLAADLVNPGVRRVDEQSRRIRL
jgi:hypothetical protein